MRLPVAVDCLVLAEQPDGLAAMLDLIALLPQNPFVHGPQAMAIAGTRASRDVCAFANERLEDLRRRLARDGRRFAALQPACQHRVRKRLKRLRYLSGLAAPLFGAKRVAHYLASWREAPRRARPIQRPAHRDRRISCASVSRTSRVRRWRAHLSTVSKRQLLRICVTPGSKDARILEALTWHTAISGSIRCRPRRGSETERLERRGVGRLRIADGVLPHRLCRYTPLMWNHHATTRSLHDESEQRSSAQARANSSRRS